MNVEEALSSLKSKQLHRMEAIVMSQLFTTTAGLAETTFTLPPSSPSRVKRLIEVMAERDLLTLDTITVRLLTSKLTVGFHYALNGSHFSSQSTSMFEHLAEGPLGFDGLRCCIEQQTLDCDLENLSGRSLWYCASLAHADETFRGKLFSRLRAFRDSQRYSDEQLHAYIESKLSIRRIVDEVEATDAIARCVFLKTLAQKGTPTMNLPFISAGIPLDEGNGVFNYLGAAALAANLDTFELLLNSGANAASMGSVRADHRHR